MYHAVGDGYERFCILPAFLAIVLPDSAGDTIPEPVFEYAP